MQRQPLLLLVLSSCTSSGLQLLCDVPTPALVIDADAVPQQEALGVLMAGPANSAMETALADAAYLHSRVQSLPAQRPPFHRDASYTLCTLDAALPDGGAFLSMGLNNDYDPSYYWARHAGPNARRPVPGIGCRVAEGGLAEIFRMSEAEATKLGRPNPNDGKWSEWCEFLKEGDQVDLVCASALAALRGSLQEGPALRRLWRL